VFYQKHFFGCNFESETLFADLSKQYQLNVSECHGINIEPSFLIVNSLQSRVHCADADSSNDRTLVSTIPYQYMPISRSWKQIYLLNRAIDDAPPPRRYQNIDHEEKNKFMRVMLPFIEDSQCLSSCNAEFRFHL